MSHPVRWIVSACLLILLVIASVLGTWKAADARLWELRFSLNNRVPTGDVVFVDIDSSSLHQVGLWPWPRSLHGQLLDRLIDMGAYEVAFDIDFSTRSTPAEDAAFAESLERAGGYAYLAAFEQRDALGRDIWNFPIEAFGAFAEAALVNVNSLEAGMVWSLPGRGHDGLKSIAGHFTPEQEAPETLRIDYAVDLSRIVRIPAAQILDGTADPGLVRDRQIVVGASALELHDLLLVPRFGIVPGPMVQIAAAETLKLDRALLSSSPWPVLILATIFLLASTFLPRARWDRVVIASVALSIMLELSAFYAYARLGIALETTVFHVAVLGVLFVRLWKSVWSAASSCVSSMPSWYFLPITTRGQAPCRRAPGCPLSQVASGSRVACRSFWCAWRTSRIQGRAWGSSSSMEPSNRSISGFRAWSAWLVGSKRT